MKKHFLTLLFFVAAFCSITRAANIENIRIMTYNIPMGNILVTDGNGQNTWINRSYAIHRYLLDVQPDLIGMQEPVRQSLIDMLVGIPNYALVGRGRNKEAADGGEYSCILYRIDRFRVIDHGTYWLTDTPDEYSKVEGAGHYRIATWAYMEDIHSGARFLYTNTHLSYESEAVTLAQIKVLKKHMFELNEKYGTNLPHLLTGDFNMYETETFNYNQVLNLKLRMRDMWNIAREKKDNCSGAKMRIDYIYATTRVFCSHAQWDNSKTEDGFWMSDHNPFWADVYFNSTAADDARGAVTKAWAEIDSTFAYTTKRIRLISSKTQITADCTESSYPTSNAIDGNGNTFYHSLYSKTAPNNPHYLQVELKNEIENFTFNYTRRSDKPGDCWNDIMITASNDLENWDYITHVYGIGEEQSLIYSSPNIALHKPYKHLRFHVLRTPSETLRNGHPQHAVAEIQLYQNLVDDNCIYSTNAEVKAAVDALKETIAQVNALIEDGTVKAEHVTAIEEGIAALREARSSATSIDDIVDAQENDATKAYGIDGRPRNSTDRGLIIINGKKLINR